jgi:hypothetical protein
MSAYRLSEEFLEMESSFADSDTDGQEKLLQSCEKRGIERTAISGASLCPHQAKAQSCSHLVGHFPTWDSIRSLVLTPVGGPEGPVDSVSGAIPLFITNGKTPGSAADFPVCNNGL